MKTGRTLPFLLAVILGFGVLPAVLEFDTAEANYQRKLLRLHNQERKKRNKPRFRKSGALQRAAVKYARVMKRDNHFDHVGPDESTPHERMLDAGFNGRTTGENIALGQRTPREVFRAWMRSSGHRRNIRRSSFNQIGFGKAGTYWVTCFGG